MPEDKKAMVSEDVLKYVRCPVTRTSLQIADADLVNSLNSKIEQGQLVNRVGETVKSKLDGGLVNEDGSILLPMRGGILNLVTDEAIELN